MILVVTVARRVVVPMYARFYDPSHPWCTPQACGKCRRWKDASCILQMSKLSSLQCVPGFCLVKNAAQLMANGWFGLVWVPGILLWKGLLLRGTPRIPNYQPKPPIHNELRSHHLERDWDSQNPENQWATGSRSYVFYSQARLQSSSGCFLVDFFLSNIWKNTSDQTANGRGH